MSKKFAFNFVSRSDSDRSRIVYIVIALLILFIIIFLLIFLINQKDITKDLPDETIVEDKDIERAVPHSREKGLDILEKKTIVEEMFKKKEVADTRSEEEKEAELKENKAATEEIFQEKEQVDPRSEEEKEAELEEKRAVVEELFKKR